jgi:phosphoribosyl-ATP pyrophosphohydrolase/phosphoribosyl-AMP cyclohydrolase
MGKKFSDKLKFNRDGLLPVIIQDNRSLGVLMMAYMNAAALERTLRTGEVHFYSRSRKSLWHKGGTSGNTQAVKEIRVDCDQDALLIRVDPAGPACHTGSVSCFFRTRKNGRLVRAKDSSGISEILDRIYSVILNRKRKPLRDSYVSSLFRGGRDRILKKIGEEAGELIISSKNRKKSEIIWEVADLWFHTLVVMGFHGITPEDIYHELEGRFGKRRPSGKRGKKK